MVSVFQIGHSIENNTKSRVSSLEVQDRHKLLHSTNRARSCFFSAPGPPFGFHSLAKARPGQLLGLKGLPGDGWIVLFWSNFRFSRVEDRPRVEQNSMPIGHNSSLGKAAQAKYTPTWLDDLAQIPNLKPLIFGFWV